MGGTEGEWKGITGDRMKMGEGPKVEVKLRVCREEVKDGGKGRGVNMGQGGEARLLAQGPLGDWFASHGTVPHC